MYVDPTAFTMLDLNFNINSQISLSQLLQQYKHDFLSCMHLDVNKCYFLWPILLR